MEGAAFSSLFFGVLLLSSTSTAWCCCLLPSPWGSADVSLFQFEFKVHVPTTLKHIKVNQSFERNKTTQSKNGGCPCLLSLGWALRSVSLHFSFGLCAAWLLLVVFFAFIWVVLLSPSPVWVVLPSSSSSSSSSFKWRCRAPFSI